MDKLLIEKTFQEYWKDKVSTDQWRMVSTNLDVDKVKEELFDYYTVLQEVPKVYDYITEGRFCKPNTDAGYILSTLEEKYELKNGYAKMVEEQEKERMRESQYWYVFCPARDKPTVKHDTEKEAQLEAERLAVQHPGEEFQVLHVTLCCKTQKPMPNWYFPKGVPK